MKARALCALTTVLALALSALTAAPARADEVVDVPDAGLHACIAARLADTGLPADFTPENLARITDLPCYGGGNLATITGLTGLEHLVGLQRLVVYRTHVTDVSPVAGLTGLWNLQVESSQRYDPAPMLGLPSLTKLMISVQTDADGALLGRFPHVTQLYVHTVQERMPALTIPAGVTELDFDGPSAGFSPVSGGAAVTRLSTGGGSMVSLDGLEGLTSVQTLWAGRSSVRDISAIAAMTQLTEAHLSNANISDLTPLRGLASLRLLSLDTNRIASLDGLSGLTGLEELDLSGNQLTGTDGLSGLPGLRVLNLRNNKIADLDGLSDLPALRRLDLSGNQLTETSAFPGLDTVADLDLAGNQLTGLAPLAHLTSLTKLDVSHNHLTSLDGVPDAPGLATIVAGDNKLEEITAVAALPALTQLSADHNALATLGPEGTLKHLTGGAFQANRLTSVAALAGIGKATLNLSDNLLTDVSPLAGIDPGSELRLQGNRLADLSPLPDGVTYYANGQRVSVPDPSVGVPVDLGLRGVSGERICPSFTPVADCADGVARFPASGTYSGYFGGGWWDPGSLGASLTVHAGPDRAFTKTYAPTVQGVPTVGLAVGPGFRQWSPKPESYSYRWYRDGVALPEDPNGYDYYNAVAADLGHRLSVCVTGHLDGFTTLTRCSRRSDRVMKGDVSFAERPSIEGTPTTDAVLTAVVKRYGDVVAFHYQWQRNGRNIRGATQATYPVRASDVGARLRVKVKGTAAGYHSHTEYSKSVTARKAALVPVVPTVTGEERVGATLTADPGAWGPAPVKLAYRWYRNTTAIATATRPSYTLTGADVGKILTVRVTGTKPGYTTASRTSARTAVVLPA